MVKFWRENSKLISLLVKAMIKTGSMKKFIFFLLILLLGFLLIFKQGFAKEISPKILSEAHRIFSGMGYVRGYEDEGCEWEIPPQISGEVNFGAHKIYYFKCLHGSYNAWYVYLITEPDGSFKPLLFPYPKVSLKNDNELKVSGISNTYSLCNPLYNEKDYTITTMCKGRGIGDVASYGVWELNIISIENWLSDKPKRNFKEFLLKKFQIDFTLDEQKNPVTLLDFTSKEKG